MKLVKHKVRFVNKYPTPIEIYSEYPVEVYIDEFCFDPIPIGTYRIVMLEEPLRGQLFDLVQRFPDYYNYVLTYEDEILQSNPKAILFHATDTWVKGYTTLSREFCVTTVVGGKNDLRMDGYAIRHELWRRQEEITIPKKFYLSGNYKWTHADYVSHPYILGDTKKPLFDAMFHICIENRSMKHYFSEKLLDCFHTRTVPIYCGCLNLEDYFNTAGTFRVSSVDELIEVCNQLTPELYERMLPAIEENFELAQPRSDYMEQLKNKITEILEKL
jgi:hypothetical protein